MAKNSYMMVFDEMLEESFNNGTLSEMGRTHEEFQKYITTMKKDVVKTVSDPRHPFHGVMSNGQIAEFNQYVNGIKQNGIPDWLRGQPKKQTGAERRAEEPIKKTPVQPVKSDPKKQPSEPNEQISKNTDAHVKNVDNTSSTEARQTSDHVASNEDHKKNEAAREVYRQVPKEESQRVVDQEEKKSTITVSDQQKEEIKVKGQKELNADVEYRKVKSGWSKMKLAGAIGLTAFGVASVLDVKKELDQDKAVERMKNIQEKEKKSRHKDERDMMKQFGYGNVDFGQMAIDMFNERIGHYKMGNSKFQ